MRRRFSSSLYARRGLQSGPAGLRLRRRCRHGWWSTDATNIITPGDTRPRVFAKKTFSEGGKPEKISRFLDRRVFLCARKILKYSCFFFLIDCLCRKKLRNRRGEITRARKPSGYYYNSIATFVCTTIVRRRATDGCLGEHTRAQATAAVVSAVFTFTDVLQRHTRCAPHRAGGRPRARASFRPGKMKEKKKGLTRERYETIPFCTR